MLYFQKLVLFFISLLYIYSNANEHHHPLLVPSDLTLDDLPPLRQSNNRILATITVELKNRPQFLSNQLDSYVTACEMGYEIHVVLITRVSWMVNHAGVYHKSRYYCNRLGIDLPIVVWIGRLNEPKTEEISSEIEHSKWKRSIDSKNWKDYYSLCNNFQLGFCPNLSFRHREVLYILKDKYDYYSSQEDDYLVNTHHLNYFLKWSKIFNGTRNHPGFTPMEVASDAHTVQSLYESSPIHWNPFNPDHYIYMLNIDQSLSPMILLPKPWVAFYIISSETLLKYSDRYAWFTDEYKPWDEYNIHFQHLWLSRYFRILIPLEEMDKAFIHHKSNRYLNEYYAIVSNQSLPQVSWQNIVETKVVVRTLNGIINGQTKAPLVDSFIETVSPWDITINYAGGGRCHGCHPSSNKCLDQNMTSVNILYFYGDDYPKSSSQKKTLARVHITCMHTNKVPIQETAVCKHSLKDKSICENGFGDDSFHF